MTAFSTASVRADWLNLAAVEGAGTAANPYHLVTNVHLSQYTFGGLITNGALAGQQFGSNGVLSPFVAGAPNRDDRRADRRQRRLSGRVHDRAAEAAIRVTCAAISTSPTASTSTSPARSTRRPIPRTPAGTRWRATPSARQNAFLPDRHDHAFRHRDDLQSQRDPEQCAAHSSGRG